MPEKPSGILMTAAPHPLRVERCVADFPEGLTIQEMVDAIQPDPVLSSYANVFIFGRKVEPHLWPYVRPKAGQHVELRIVPAGGDGKNPLRLILTIVVIAAAAILAPELAPYLINLGLPEAAAIGLSQALIGFAGMLVVNAIAPVRPPELRGNETQRDSPSYFIEGARNQARPFQPVPVVLGKHRVVPPYGAAPWTMVLGYDQYVNMLFVWGVAPLELDTSSLKIGDTPLDQFDDYSIEHQMDGDPIALFLKTRIETSLSVKLEQTASWQTRTTGPDADEISYDVTFPRGLVEFGNDGSRSPRTVAIEVQYRKVGDVTWLTPNYTGFGAPGVDPGTSEFDITANRTAATRFGFVWDTAERAQYEVRIRRTTADTSSNQIFDEVFWSALRTITHEDPVNSQVPLAKTALRIRANDQLNGIVDQLSGVVTSVGKYVQPNGLSWSGVGDTQAIRGPGELMRLVLQGNGNANPLSDSRIDLTSLREFENHCVSNGFTFDMVRDFSSSVWETLADIAAAGRGAPTQIDGKWSVVWEQVQNTPVSHITPRNSYDFKAEKAFPRQPHAWRIRFPNEDQDYRIDERRVYRDGFSSANATIFETLELPGVVNADQVFRLGRFRIAQGMVQAERFIFRQDMEYLTYRRGDRVSITHDVLLAGLAFGRVKSVDVDTNGDVVALTVDEECPMSAGTDYGIAIRTIANGEVTSQVVTDAGNQTDLTLSSPVTATIVAGDLFGFGELGSETIDASVVAIEPDTEFQARVTCVPYEPSIFDADTEAVPTFSTNLTALAVLPEPSVRGIVSDESVLTRGPGQSLRVRVAIDFDPLEDPRLRDAYVEVQGRPSNTSQDYDPMDIDESSEGRVIVVGVQDGETWDFRIRFRVSGRLPGPWTSLSPHTVVGRSTPPDGLTGLTVSAFGGQAFMRWDRPSELDVVFGGEVRFRHSSLFSGATWAGSTSVGEAARARDLIATLPLKPGTYLARVFDVAGNPSTVIASVTTKQASVLAFSGTASLDEAPSFSGTHTNTVSVSNTLKLTGADPIDDWGLIDDVAVWDGESGVLSSGTYDFASGFDLGSVTRVRLTVRITGTTVVVNDLIDARVEPVDDWEDWDGTDQAQADAYVEVRHTDDDPGATSPSWSAWERLDSAEFEARGFEFRAQLTSQDRAYNIEVTELGVDVEEII